MPQRPTRSLKHEYELYIEAEIENYKESVPRSTLLSIGDEAVASLAAQQQLALTELLMVEEVDRIIFRRLRLPSYSTWRRRRLKQLQELRRPEYWGLHPDGPLVRALPHPSDGSVLVAGASGEGSALYLAAHGCEVMALDQEIDVIQRVLQAAEAAGLASRVHAEVGDLGSWSPDAPLAALVCTPAAFAGLSKRDRDRVFAVLQSATKDGGVHLVDTIVAGQTALTLEELRARYRGWEISIEPGKGASSTFLARKDK